MKLFLHVGYPKTGTSAIQSFLAKNDEDLKKIGYLYPQTGRLGDAHYGFSSAFGLGRHSAADPKTTPQKIRTSLDEELAKSKCTNLVISSENLILCKNPKIFADAFEGFEIHPVVYLRRHDDWFESAYNQSVRMVQDPPWGKTIESFVEFQLRREALPFDYHALLSLWRDSFPGVKLIVRPFEKEQNQPDIFSDFLTAIGIPMKPEFNTALRSAGNESISSERLMVIDAIQRTNAPSALKNRLVTRIIKSKEPSPTRCTFLSPSARLELLNKFSSSYERVARDFLGRPEGQLFVAPEPELTDEWAPPDRPDWRRSVDIIVDALSDKA